ncbi:TPA: molybdenum ABC transporter ATP-binding protein ModC [Yersinia enterocolitica]|uniref:molybdenum ABC transporter ATP-binding protein ModC n=1 Tax=Yersinia enterocolitica TaxID=630 RepID=UPI0029A7D072|nr:molybdenum ABC transporter ATP-binding protein ModC [Yersinia enterocolitica]EKN4848950.1 molybdenum ABC transporter ATP-binding protein ModC [Yersinia enterocolitica]EKN5120235.1 molybdenum ABC transporter ATP-binding protein ModC [Yersinia enterocolitica]EMA9250948.1 molybdenum ABC transporter ATP-binding protein ModC [Yersinia enterocolitica]EMA9426095.1 molybdenum ABC transporter ATP-binding protein ModC [Yersinia enterocolitica]
MLELDFSQQLGDLHLQVSTNLPAQGITAIFGLSGAGKTSLINVIGGLTRPQQGKVVLNGRVLVDAEQNIYLPPEKRRVGYVFQDARLFPHYRVMGNLQYGMNPSMRGQFDTIVGLLGIEALLGRFPLTLSGGEKQRVAIGRALLTAPELLLMDEPLASLDLPRKRELLPYLERLAQDVNTPILYVSHSMDEILRLADQVVVMDAGKVCAVGGLEEVWASSALRPWLQREEPSSILRVSVIGHHDRYAMTALALGDQRLWVGKLEAQEGESMRIRINAADVSLVLQPPQNSSIRNILPVKIAECLEVDGQIDVKLAVGDQWLWARITPWARDELGLKPGQWVYAQIKSVSFNRKN